MNFAGPTTKISCGPTLQLDTDDLQFNVNPALTRSVGAQDAVRATLGYQWQVKHLLGPRFETGLQGFGDVGPWNHWLPGSQQEHTVGPAIFAKWPIAGGHMLRLDAAWLVGLTDGSARNTLRLRLQQDF